MLRFLTAGESRPLAHGHPEGAGRAALSSEHIDRELARQQAMAADG
jgi:hypothetical protein